MQEWFVQPGFPRSKTRDLLCTRCPSMSSVSDQSGDGTSTARARAGCGDGGGRSGEGHTGSRIGDAGFPDSCSSIGSGALGLNGSTRGSSLDFVAGMAGDTNPERPVSLKWLSVSHRSFSTSWRLASSFPRAWLLVILLSLKVFARSLSRDNCAGDLRLYPMFRPLFASVEPTLDTLWRGENLTLTTTAPDFSS